MIDEDLLIHNVTAKKINGYDEDNEAVYTETELSKVRISVEEKWVAGSNGMAKGDVMTLYFDPSVSTPSDFVPVEGMQITWNEKGYTVRSVKPSYSVNSTPDFYRMDLV